MELSRKYPGCHVTVGARSQAEQVCLEGSKSFGITFLLTISQFWRQFWLHIGSYWLLKLLKLLTLLMRQSLAFSANAPATRSAAPPLWGGASRRRNRATAPGIWSKSSWKSLAPAISGDGQIWKMSAGSCWKLLEAGISSSATVWLFGDIHATFTRTSAILSETTT